ncbi:MAG: hypothetical protein LBC09_01920, partial [Helicobacteraceae bacterium]|nr:hypothetical protein [Helicobacteraceae bacterium]
MSNDDRSKSSRASKNRKTDEISPEEAASGIYEIPEKLDLAEAAWYYNVLENRRDEVYAMYFARLKRMDEWLEAYAAAKDDSPAKEMAFEKLSALATDAKALVELREARFDDKRIVELCERRIAEISGDDFGKWKEIYDLAPFGSPLQINAMRRMRPLAKTLGEWRDIYDRAEIGSPAQTDATQNMLLLSRFDEIAREDAIASEKEFVERANERTPREWREEYEKYDLY